ncbi:MAG: ATP-dependent Clp protease ATP-binding subunit, partial [Candidatus Nealsonbacteria bacterium]|nr:ATP-dependent Clp protease ATP-binding subunit [Candidatus Nealsonbacteria bacterium]
DLDLPRPDEAADLANLWLESLKNAQKRSSNVITCGHLLTALAKSDPLLKKILIETGLKSEDIDNLTWWWESSQKKIEERKRFWEYKNLVKIGGLAKSWSAGYTITLDQYAIDWTEMIERKGFEEIVGHEKEVGQIERVLARTEVNNVLVVGEVGSGRGALLQALTQKILFGESLPELNYKRVVELDVSLLINRCQSQEKTGAALEQIFQEVLMAGNIILIIQDFHNFIGGNLRPGTIDISGTLAAYLRIPQFRLIAVSDFASFHRFIEPNMIASVFEKVEVAEVSLDETIRLLELFVPGWEAKYKKFISYPAIKELVIEADRYLPAIPFPKKATDLMAELLVELSRDKELLILPRHVSQIVSEKTEIPIGQISLEEKQNLLDLENLLHGRIINQNEAVEEVSSALRRARSDITIRKGPMGTFLFLGPTGVGKTETAKALAAVYFGSEERMIRLDLSEFQNPADLKRLIGSPDEESFFVTQVRDNPFSLVLLDEIEKAHPNILNLFLQVLDEGSMRDGLGRRVNFLNTIIIATSNAGYKIILQAIEEKLEMPSIKEKLLAYVFNEGIFRPEFINRFDAVVVFKSLTPENLLGIADLLLKKLKKNLSEKGIDLIISPELKAEVVKLGYDPIFGARQMRRVIQDKIENVLAQALLAGQLKRGTRVEILVPEFKLKLL